MGTRKHLLAVCPVAAETKSDVMCEPERQTRTFQRQKFQVKMTVGLSLHLVFTFFGKFERFEAEQ